MDIVEALQHDNAMVEGKYSFGLRDESAGARGMVRFKPRDGLISNVIDRVTVRIGPDKLFCAYDFEPAERCIRVPTKNRSRKIVERRNLNRNDSKVALRGDSTNISFLMARIRIHLPTYRVHSRHIS